MLKAKIDAGATGAITQFFFDNEVYFRYLDRVRARGIDHADRAGHHPDPQFQAGLKLCRATAARACRTGSAIVSTGWTTTRRRAISSPPRSRPSRCWASLQGITEFHFYTLNRADLVYAICHLLGLRPAKAFTEVKAAS